MSFLRNLAAGLLCVVLMSSCFVPDRFEAEIRVTKDGSYGVTYIGILTWAPLYGQIARGEVDAEKAAASQKLFYEQLKREAAFKEVESLGRGRFRVRYERTGRFGGKHQMVTFVSRQEPIFRILTTEANTLEVNGSGKARMYAKALAEVGLTTQGLFRVVTDMEVVTSNAEFQRKSTTPGYTQYDWRFRNFTEIPPRIVMKLALDPRTGVPVYGGSAENVEMEEAPKQ